MPINLIGKSKPFLPLTTLQGMEKELLKGNPEPPAQVKAGKSRHLGRGVEGLTSTGQGDKRIDEERLKKACSDFESIFIHQVLKSMRQTVPQTGFFGEGPEKEIFQSFFDQELSKSLAQQGGLGLGNRLYRQMMKYGKANLFDSTQAPQINKINKR